MQENETETPTAFELEVKNLFDNMALYIKLAMDEKFDKELYEFDVAHPTLEK